MNVIFSLATIIIVAIAAIGLSSTGAFNVYGPRITEDLANFRHQFSKSVGDKKQESQWANNFNSSRKNTVLYSWLRDALNNLGLDFLQEKQKFGYQLDDETTQKSISGVVLRTASKHYDPEHSKPSSSLYTTKKNTQTHIIVRPEGVDGDYNHYRTTALSSTPDRALSILTTDTLELLKNAGYSQIEIGDLGENIYVDGVDYKFFEIGKQYKFVNSKNKSTKGYTEDGVIIIEITERIEPCGNLCKLGFINDEAVPPSLRFENCKKFLLWLDQKDGLRGWYAKVIGDGGQVQIGDQVFVVR